MKKYEVSFNGKRFNRKPSGSEIGKISNELYTKSLDYTELAYEVGEYGCTFSPAVYNGKRRKENYIGQQLIGLDFDSGITFSEIKNIAEKYRLPILFAYKTFSYTEEHQKFRVVFALKGMVMDSFTCESLVSMFMKIFGECDEACKDCSRMFFGGKGLLELADEPVEIYGEDVIISLVTYMNDRYGANHYTRELRKFYHNIGIKYEKNIPVIENNKFVCTGTVRQAQKNLSVNKSIKKGRRTVTRNFDWNILYDKCRLYRDFVDGTEYYYYPQLFHIATNLVNIEKGRNEFLKILNSENNSNCEAYHKRDWDMILKIIINMDYQPHGCCNCPYKNECLHAKNMILTAKPGKSTILQTVRKDYVSIQEAEIDLKNNFQKAVLSDKQGIHIIKAQTGIGKTNLYLDYLKESDKTFLIAVPTHKLKMEIYYKALSKGIKNIAYTPEMPIFKSEIEERIRHIYDIGAGEYALVILRDIFDNMNPDHEDYIKLENYLESLDSIKDFEGHIITTHDRLLLINNKSKLLNGREVIIDEDIMRSLLSTNTVSNDEIFQAIKNGKFSVNTEKRLKSIISSTEGYQRYDYRSNEKIEITDELFESLENINGNIIDLTQSCYVFRGDTDTIFLKRRWLPCKKVIVMSATANADVYSMLTHYNIYYYPCNTAEYMGELKLYPKYSFSRYALKNQKGIIDYLKNQIGDDTVITFKEFENMFDTRYHYGAIEGLNCLEGKNISVIGLPNVDESVYKLYGMASGIDVDNCNMRPLRIDFNGYNFNINSFDNLNLRTIQLWLLESLLEQAVGRARLLRFNCTVKVFARFPIEQAVIE